MGHDHRFGQLENLDCASQAPLHPGYASYASLRVLAANRTQAVIEASRRGLIPPPVDYSLDTAD